MGFMMVSCATTSATMTDKYPQLTSDHVTSKCESSEAWQIRVMPMPALVLRYSKCAGINDLLIIITPIDGFTNKQRSLTAELASSYYVEYINREQSSDDTKKWTIKLIKQESRNSDADGKQEAFFYIVSFTEGKTE